MVFPNPYSGCWGRFAGKPAHVTVKITTETTIERTPAQVWPIISDPTLIPEWNTRISDVEPVDEGRPRLGSQYEIIGVLGSRRRVMQAEIVAFRPGTELGLRYRDEEFPRDGRVTESLSIEPMLNGSKMTHVVDFSEANLPILVRLFMRTIHALGRPREKMMLIQLKELIETVT